MKALIILCKVALTDKVKIFTFKMLCHLSFQEQNTYFLQEIVLFESNFDHPAKLRNLVSESSNAAALHSGVTSTVTEEKSLQSHMESLSEGEK